MAYRKKPGQKQKHSKRRANQAQPDAALASAAMPGVMDHDEAVSWNIALRVEMLRLLNSDIPGLQPRDYERYGVSPLPPEGSLRGKTVATDRGSIARTVATYLKRGDTGSFSEDEVQFACMYAMAKSFAGYTETEITSDPVIHAFERTIESGYSSTTIFENSKTIITERFHALANTGNLNVLLLAEVFLGVQTYSHYHDTFSDLLATTFGIEEIFGFFASIDFLLESEREFLRREILIRSPLSTPMSKDAYNIRSFLRGALPTFVKQRRERLADIHHASFKPSFETRSSADIADGVRMRRIHALFRMHGFREAGSEEIKQVVHAEEGLIRNFILVATTTQMSTESLESPFGTIVSSDAFEPSISISDQIITVFRFLSIPEKERFESSHQLMLWLSGEYRIAHSTPEARNEVRFVEACVSLQLDPRSVRFGGTHQISPHMASLLKAWESQNFKTMSVSQVLSVARSTLIQGTQYIMKLAVQPFERRERRFSGPPS